MDSENNYRNTFASNNAVFIIGLILFFGVFFTFGAFYILKALNALGIPSMYIYITIIVGFMGIALLVIGLLISQHKRAMYCRVYYKQQELKEYGGEPTTTFVRPPRNPFPPQD